MEYSEHKRDEINELMTDDNALMFSSRIITKDRRVINCEIEQCSYVNDMDENTTESAAYTFYVVETTNDPFINYTLQYRLFDNYNEALKALTDYMQSFKYSNLHINDYDSFNDCFSISIDNGKEQIIDAEQIMNDYPDVKYYYDNEIEIDDPSSLIDRNILIRL